MDPLFQCHYPAHASRHSGRAAGKLTQKGDSIAGACKHLGVFYLQAQGWAGSSARLGSAGQLPGAPLCGLSFLTAWGPQGRLLLWRPRTSEWVLVEKVEAVWPLGRCTKAQLLPFYLGQSPRIFLSYALGGSSRPPRFQGKHIDPALSGEGPDTTLTCVLIPRGKHFYLFYFYS